MFCFLKKKKDMPNRVFGNVRRFDGYWSTNLQAEVTLWERQYLLSCMIYANSEHTEITREQEDAYQYFVQNGKMICKAAENLLADYFGTVDATVVLSKFEPYQLMISPNGECAIVAKNADDGNLHDALPGLAVVIFPKLAVFTKEDYLEYALRDGCDEIKTMLYGGE